MRRKWGAVEEKEMGGRAVEEKEMGGRAVEEKEVRGGLWKTRRWGNWERRFKKEKYEGEKERRSGVRSVRRKRRYLLKRAWEGVGFDWHIIGIMCIRCRCKDEYFKMFDDLNSV